MTENTEVQLQEFEDGLHLFMKCKCCGFVLTSEIENDDIKAYLMAKVRKMSVIFDDKKKG